MASNTVNVGKFNWYAYWTASKFATFEAEKLEIIP